MTRVQRPPIKADIGAETARLDEPLRRVVTWLAERLERAEPEFVDVAAMWLDVIADGRRRDDAALEAERTQRMLEQLVPSNPSPASTTRPTSSVCRERPSPNLSSAAEAPITGCCSVLPNRRSMRLRHCRWTHQRPWHHVAY
jgi:hypothetical protein